MTTPSRTPLSKWRTRFVRLNGNESAGQLVASIRNVTRATGLPVGPALPPKTNTLNVSQLLMPPRSPRAATVPKSSSTKGP